MDRPIVEKYIETKCEKIWAELTTCEQNDLIKRKLGPVASKEKVERKPEAPKAKK